MFSLIITIIAIALVAALALATLYYGGSAMKKSSSEAQAAKVITQGQQILGAAEVFRADNGRWPDSLNELVAQKYLTTIPVALFTEPTGAFSQTAFADTPWEMPTPGNPTFVLSDAVSVEVCQATNKKSLGTSGILKQAYSAYRAQCFGSSDSQLRVVISSDPSLLSGALAAGELATSPPPANSDLTNTAWLVAPGASVQNGGTSGGTDPVAPQGCVAPAGFDVLGCPFDIYLGPDGPYGEELLNVYANRSFTVAPTISVEISGASAVAGYSNNSGEPTAQPSLSSYDAQQGHITPEVRVYSAGLEPGAVVQGTLVITTEFGVVRAPFTFYNMEKPGGDRPK